MQNNVHNTTPAQFREKYINYLIKNWSYDITPDGFMAKNSARIMNNINTQYFIPRECGFNLEIEEGDTTILIERSDLKPTVNGSYIVPPRVGFKNGRLLLNR